jgi:TonB-dependent SusC/RagA subfamily outer membrane receptor
MHVIRRDPLANLVVAVVRSVLWFHPLVHLASRYFRIDQELACDAAVLEGRPHDRSRYAHALLKTQFGGQELTAGCCLASRTVSSLKRRIIMLRTPAPGFWRRLLGATVVALSGMVSGSLAWALQTPQTPAIQTDSTVQNARGKTDSRHRQVTVTWGDTTTAIADSVSYSTGIESTGIDSVTGGVLEEVREPRIQWEPGAPGNPSRLRLRSLSSQLRSNDPIVIVDGVRVSATRVTVSYDSTQVTGANAAPSPLDYIDPNTIERIEVLKGPSAVTLYGEDAANGAIIVTRKKHQP